jgi:hypothetical protein
LPLAALGMAVAVCLIFAKPARAFPAYAEEWSVPGNPQEVEVDPLGRVWVASFDDSIRVYAPTGGELLFAFGGSGTGDGQFQNPYGMAFDAAGDAYICDYLGVRVEKFDASGNFLFSWPTPGSRADHIAFDAAGDVYVSDFSNQFVHKYTAAGVPLLDWASNGLSYPSGVAESGGVIHVVQWSAPTVEQFLPDGTYLGAFDTGAQNATDIEVDADGQLWLADYANGRIRVFASDGTPVDSAGAVGAGAGEFQGLSGLAIGLDGSIYASDEQNSRVQRFGPSSAGVTPGASHITPGSSAIRSIAPNPCRASATVMFALAREERVRLSVLDVGGRLVETLVDGTMSAGAHPVAWNARARGGATLPAGIYLVRLEHGKQVESRRLVLLH